MLRTSGIHTFLKQATTVPTMRNTELARSAMPHLRKISEEDSTKKVRAKPAAEFINKEIIAAAAMQRTTVTVRAFFMTIISFRQIIYIVYHKRQDKCKRGNEFSIFDKLF